MWSPDGSEIAFTRQASDGSSAIYVIWPGGKSPTRVVANAIGPTWSPDGRQIAFTRASATSFATSLRVVSRNGSGDRRVHSSEVGLVDADWSPDGTELLYTWVFEDSSNIERVGADGSNARSVAGIPPRVEITDTVTGPAWSPDGTRIAYSRNRSADNECANPDPTSCYQFEIAVVNADGTGDRRLLKLLGSDEQGPAWSPDGGRSHSARTSPGRHRSG